MGLFDDSCIEFPINLEGKCETIPTALRLRTKCPLHTTVIEQRETIINTVSMRCNYHQRFWFRCCYASAKLLHCGACRQCFLCILFPQQRNNHTAMRSDTSKYKATHIFSSLASKCPKSTISCFIVPSLGVSDVK